MTNGDEASKWVAAPLRMPTLVDDDGGSPREIDWESAFLPNRYNLNARDLRAPVFEDQIAGISRGLEEYEKEMFVDASAEELIRAQLIGVGPAVVDEICSRVNIKDRDAFYEDSKKVEKADISLKLAVIGHYVEKCFQDSILDILSNVLYHGREIVTNDEDPKFYDQVVKDAYVLESKTLVDKSDESIYAELISTKDMVRQRLNGVGRHIITEVIDNFDRYHWIEPEGTAKKFYDDLQAAEMGDRTKIAGIHRSLDIRVAKHVGVVVQDLYDYAIKFGTVIRGNPQLYRQMIKAAPILGTMLRNHDDTVCAGLLQKMVDWNHANIRPETVGLSGSSIVTSDDRSRKRKATHSPEDRDRQRSSR